MQIKFNDTLGRVNLNFFISKKIKAGPEVDISSRNCHHLLALLAGSGPKIFQLSTRIMTRFPSKIILV